MLPLVVQATDVPAGIYLLTPPGQQVSSSALSSPLVSGFVLRGDWQTLQPEPGELKVDYYREQLDRIQRAGKVASLVITSGGLNTPGFVLSQGVQTLEFQDKNPYHKTRNQQLAIPLFWDKTFLQKKLAFIQQLGDALAKHPALVLVSAQCANATTDDWNIPSTLQWGKVRFDDRHLLEACEQVIDQTALSFPNQSVRLALGSMPGKLRQYRNLPGQIAAYGERTLGDRFFVQRHNLSVNTPKPDQTKRLMGWQVIADAGPQSGAQYLWPASDTRTCRANGGKTPCDGEEILAQINRVIAGYNFRYVELYGADWRNYSDGQAITELASLFGDSQEAQARREPVVPVRQLSPAGGPGPKGAFRSTERPGSDASPSGGVYGQWSNPPMANTRNSPAKHYEMRSQLLSTQVGFSLYLPNGFKPGDETIPVIYWLHGKQGDESRGAYIAGFLEEAIHKKLIRPTAMVIVNGGLQSFYSNSKDGKTPVEAMIMEELIPHVESTFGIGGDRKNRLLEGFSMGGFGALKLAAKYPDKFLSVSTYGGAFLGRDFLPKRQDAEAYAQVFANDAAYFVENSPEYWLEKNASLIQKLGLAIRMRVGDRDGTRRYNDHVDKTLSREGIQHSFEVLPGVSHAPRQYYDKDQLASFAFHEQALRNAR